MYSTDEKNMHTDHYIYLELYALDRRKCITVDKLEILVNMMLSIMRICISNLKIL